MFPPLPRNTLRRGAPVSRSILIALCILALPLPGAAQDKGTDQNPAALQTARQHTARTLDSVQVTGKRPDTYAPERAPTVAGPMRLTLRETAQSVSVITHQRMQDQGLTTAIDALRWVPGLRLDRLDESENTTVYSRGWRLDNIQIDGLSIQGNRMTLPADLALYDSVEVLRGAAGLFSGSGTNGSPGGAINLTRKRAMREKRITTQLFAGSFDNYRATLDANIPLSTDGRVRARGIVSHIDRGFHYDRGYRKNTTLGGTLAFELGERTELGLGLDAERRKAMPSYYGLARNWDGSDPGWPRSKSTLLPWGGRRINEYGAHVKLEHTLSNQWRLDFHYTRKKSDSLSDYAAINNSVDRETGNLTYYVNSIWGQSANHDEAFDAHLNGQFELFGKQHEFVTGLNAQRNRYWSLSPLPRGYGYDWTYHRVPVDFVNFDPSLYPRRPNTVDDARKTYYEPDWQIGVYANFRLKLTDSLVLTTGARNTRYHEGGYTRYYTDPPVHKAGSHERSGVVTPFAALSYDLSQRHTLHASYTDIFRIQNAYDINGNLVDPLLGENYELGWKSEWNGGLFNTMLTAYKLDRVNGIWIVMYSPCLPLLEKRGIEGHCYVADDKERTIGVDAEMTGQLTPSWDISLGASWLRKKNVRYTAHGGAPHSAQGQSWSDHRPARTWSAWSVHRLPGAASRWRIGLGLQGQSKIWSNYSQQTYRHPQTDEITAIRPGGRIEQRRYTIFNGMLAFEISERWNAQLNVDNLFNGRYLTTLSSWWITETEPRRFALTITGRLD